MADEELNSKMAEVAFQWLVPYIEKRKQNRVQVLKQLFKDGKTDGSLYVGNVAAIDELDDLVSYIGSKIRNAKQKEKEVHDVRSNSRTR